MRMKNKALLIILFLPCVLFAQDKDVELWASVKFSKKLTKYLRFELQEQIRWADSLRQYDKNFSQWGVKYKVLKSHTLGLSLRFVDPAEKDKYMRMNFDLSSSKKFEKIPFSLKHRFRYQQSWDVFGAADESYLRSKLGIQFRRKIISPYLAIEYYYQLDGINEFKKKRNTLGLQWALNEDMKMEFFLRDQEELNKKKKDQVVILGCGMHYKF